MAGQPASSDFWIPTHVGNPIRTLLEELNEYEVLIVVKAQSASKARRRDVQFHHLRSCWQSVIQTPALRIDQIVFYRGTNSYEHVADHFVSVIPASDQRDHSA